MKFVKKYFPVTHVSNIQTHRNHEQKAFFSQRKVLMFCCFTDSFLSAKENSEELTCSLFPVLSKHLMVPADYLTASKTKQLLFGSF